MLVQLVESALDVVLLPDMAVVEGDFFAVRQQIAVQSAVLALQALLLCGEAAERRRDQSDDQAREAVPGECHRRALPSDELLQLLREEPHVEKRLGQVRVERSEG